MFYKTQEYQIQRITNFQAIIPLSINYLLQFCGCLSNLDLFNVPFTPSLSKADRFQYKTRTGALISLIIVILSIIYSIYILYQWLSFEFLAKVTQQSSIIENDRVIELENIDFKLYSWNKDTINPFDTKKNVLSPYLISNNNLSSYTSLYQFVNDDEYKFSPQLSLSYQSEFYILFQICNETGDYICASKDEIEQFFNQQGNEIWIFMNFKVVNPTSFKTETYTRYYTMSIDKNQCLTQRLQLQPYRFELSSSYFFNDFSYQYAYGDTIQQTYVNSLNYCSKTYQQKDVIGVVYFAVDQKLTVQKYQYPQIGEVFAQIGSIVSVLFVIQYIMIEFNRKYMIEELLSQLILQYYPEMSQYVVKKGVFGQIQKVIHKSKQIDIQSYKIFMKDVQSKLEIKLSYVNLLYEVSRMQFLLQTFMPRQNLYKSHALGIKVKYREEAKLHIILDNHTKSLSNEEMLASHNNQIDNQFYQQSDINILSLDQKEKADLLIEDQEMGNFPLDS
ncbi:hypothetical protein pb186bvf_016667 [Paramecium bursaria]